MIAVGHPRPVYGKAQLSKENLAYIAINTYIANGNWQLYILPKAFIYLYRPIWTGLHKMNFTEQFKQYHGCAMYTNSFPNSMMYMPYFPLLQGMTFRCWELVLY